MTEKTNQSVFTSIAQTNAWKNPESISGPGSTMKATQVLRAGLPLLLTHFNIRTLVDAPCGDLNWMRHVEYVFDQYTGVDVVPEIIERLQKEGFPKPYSFMVGDITADILPKADALLCRDCLTHLPFDAIQQAVYLWKRAGFDYIIATTFPDWKENKDCPPGGWRPLNMEAAPFYWPPARAIMAEKANLPPPYEHKSLGVWSF
jgi:hypothetical protein